MDEVAVLMSTYNGEKYLREQLDSILAQESVNINLYIRDDGSRDHTINIINDYIDRDRSILLFEGNNVGVGNSFMELVKAAQLSADYFAFADQDDIWLKDKLKAGIRAISNADIPMCYCSNQTLVDGRGVPIKTRHEEPIDTSYLQILCNNKISGCTMVWNQALQRLLIDDDRLPTPDLLHKRIHDVWVTMVAAVAGEIYYDSDSYIYYRQHENNVVGVRNTGVLTEWKKKIANPTLRCGRSSLAREVVSNFSDLITDKNILEKLEKCAYYQRNLRNKSLLARDSEIRLYSGETAFGYRLKVLLGLF